MVGRWGRGHLSLDWVDGERVLAHSVTIHWITVKTLHSVALALSCVQQGSWLLPRQKARECAIPVDRSLFIVIQSSWFCLMLTLAIENLHFPAWDTRLRMQQ